MADTSVQKLFRIKTFIVVKDLGDEGECLLGYLVAESADKVYDFIERTYMCEYGEYKWSDLSHMSKEKILEACGDFDDECEGEFYDQKYGWEEVGVVTPAQIAVLQQLGILLSKE